VTVTSRPIADTPNSYNVEYQDSLNGYQQDSFSVSNPDDIALAGQEVTATLMAVGIPNYDQAGRILQFNLDKSMSLETLISNLIPASRRSGSGPATSSPSPI
jgi:hypothetical protein